MRWISDEALDRLRAAGESVDSAATRYEIGERIGRGGMGTVYLATDTRLERKVALKVLDAADESGELAARLAREAKVLARLEHPGIVPIHDVGELADGRLFYAMKYVDGTRLDRYARGSHSIPERLRTFVRICEAVAFAHARGVLHRDLKPENIMVGSFGEVLVMDWGVAKVLAGHEVSETAATVILPRGAAAAEATEHGVVLGTPGYMAPEQARGEVRSLDARADVYSLGAVLRDLLTGQPATADAETVALESRAGTPPALAGVPLARRLRAVVAKAMSPAAADRYPTAAELARDVERYLDGQTVSALPESVWTRAGRFVSRHRIAFYLILAYVVVRLAVVLFLGSAWFTPEARPKLGDIILWSAVKDVMAGFLIGVFAVFVRSWKAVAAFGLLVGLALALWVASAPDPETGKHYYLAIMLPGSMVGLLVGYLTAKYGGRPMAAAAASSS